MILRDTSTARQYVLRRRPGETLSAYLERERRFGLLANATLVVNDPTYVERELERVDDLISVHDILVAWSSGRITDDQASRLIELDADDDLHTIARDNGIPPPTT